MTEQPKNTDAELTQFVTRELTTLPAEMASAELQMAKLAFDVRYARSEYDDAELNAQVNCEAPGKNAEQRKLQLDKAALDDPAARFARTKVVGLESMHLGAEVHFNELLRRYKAALVLAELQTQKIAYRVTFQPRNR